MAPFDGSGNFVLSDTIAPATNADANELQAILTDIQDAIDACVVADGQSTITAGLKGADGTASLPAYSFAADLNSGLYRIGSDNIGLSLGGTKRIDFGTAGTAITGTFDATSYTDPLTVTSTTAGAGIGPLLTLYRNKTASVSDIIGGVQFDSNNSTPARKTFGTIKTLVTDPTAGSEDAILIMQQLIAGANTIIFQSAAAGIGLFGSLSIVGALTGVTNITMNGAISGVTAPTVPSLTSDGASHTYTPSAGMVRIRVRMCGGGSGGGGSTANNGNAGTATLFADWTANPGSVGGGNGGAGGAGGTGGTVGTGTQVFRVAGGAGNGSGSTVVANVSLPGGVGGSNPLGGAGGGGQNGAGGTNAAANTGGGGGGAGGTSASNSGGGGGAGEYVEFYMTAAQVGASKTYTIGAKGTGGAAGGRAGGDGATGALIIEELYA